jgi:hypothetical protein
MVVDLTRCPFVDTAGVAAPVAVHRPGLPVMRSWEWWFLRPSARPRGEPLGARRAMIGHLAADPFFFAGASWWWTAVSGAIAFRASSANFRWLASICSAKS